MTFLAAQTYLKTRTSALSAQLFSRDQIAALLEEPLEEIAKRPEMSAMFQADRPPDQLNRTAERSLLHALMLDLSVLLRPLDGIGRATLVHWSHKFELYNLKAIIRGKLQGLSYEQITGSLHDLPPLISLPHEELVRSENIVELLRRLESGPYADIARQARRVYKQRNEPFSLDATIDQRYYTGLLRQARGVAEEDRTPLLRMIGVLVDRQNLTWLTRYRFYYGLSASETYYLLVPFGHHLHREQLETLVDIDDFGQLAGRLPDPLAALLSHAETPMAAELALDAEVARQARHSLRYAESAVTRALAYLVLREMDLKTLHAVVQGRVLGFDEALIRSAAGIEESDATGPAAAGGQRV